MINYFYCKFCGFYGKINGASTCLCGKEMEASIGMPSDSARWLHKLKKWCGSTPKCDFCKKTDLTFFVDGSTIHRGMWGLMCEECFLRNGVGIGTGRGQKYHLHISGQFIKTEG